MGWSPMSFPGSSGLTSVQMTAIASNFYSVFAQESGGPQPSGIWSFSNTSIINAPGSHNFGQITAGQITATSGFVVGGQAAKSLIQEIFVEARSSFTTGVAGVYSSYLVASFSPKFSDSLIRLTVTAGLFAIGPNTSRLTAMLTRGVTSASLTISLGSNPGIGPMVGDAGASTSVVGNISLIAEETSPGSGTPLQYHLRWAEVFSGGGNSRMIHGQIRVEELR